MSEEEIVPTIRDMVHRCKRCGNGCFEVNKDGLCKACVAGKELPPIPDCGKDILFDI